MQPKICVLTPTYKRPELLAELLDCYLKQDYPRHLRHLLIYDDVGQYQSVCNEDYTLISEQRERLSITEKRDELARRVPEDCDYVTVADDDDLYYPHWLSTFAQHLEPDVDLLCSRSYLLYSEISGAPLTIHHSPPHHIGSLMTRDLHLRSREGLRPANAMEDIEWYARVLALAKNKKEFLSGKPFHLKREITGYHELPWACETERLQRMDERTSVVYDIQLQPRDTEPILKKIWQQLYSPRETSWATVSPTMLGHNEMEVIEVWNEQHRDRSPVLTRHPFLYMHAPAMFTVVVRQKVRVRAGCFNDQHMHAPVRFEIDDLEIGRLNESRNVTDWATLLPGVSYRLSLSVESFDNWGCHTFLVFDTGEKS